MPGCRRGGEGSQVVVESGSLAGPALGDRDVAGREERRRHLTDDDADAFNGGSDGLRDRRRDGADHGAQLLGRTTLDQGDLHDGHQGPPLMKMEPRWVKWQATDDPGGE